MGNPSSKMLGLITAALYIGGFVGALAAAFPADRFGRRFVLQLGQFVEVIGSVMQAVSEDRGLFIGGRVVVGFGMSLTTVAGPNLLAETCHPRLRGKVAPAVSYTWVPDVTPASSTALADWFARSSTRCGMSGPSSLDGCASEPGI